MAGVTDRPFRQLCRELGAGLAVSEMVTSNATLWQSQKTQHRIDHKGEDSPRIVQIAGADPELMAMAAQFNADNGADIIDINMGCPAKKVCNVMAGSALLQNETLVASILESVVKAVNVPVTLKIRTGRDREHRNGPVIARIAEQSGIQMLTVHGRTRACGFSGAAEHDTVREIKAQVSIPVVANGDITTPQQAASVLQYTRADGIMIGRAAQGNPWIFREIVHYLATGELLKMPSTEEIYATLVSHLQNLYEFYGEFMGVRIARKHIGWYCKHRRGVKLFRALVNAAETADEQLYIVQDYFSGQTEQELAA
ncbi:MAG: tRNA-dihydrouridine synthase [Gammaproteobacteria bacterium]|nr:tRNA-dihydrouridine synthase [Gammaproteobacteria bacterium]